MLGPVLLQLFLHSDLDNYSAFGISVVVETREELEEITYIIVDHTGSTGTVPYYVGKIFVANDEKCGGTVRTHIVRTVRRRRLVPYDFRGPTRPREQRTSGCEFRCPARFLFFLATRRTNYRYYIR